MSRSNRMLRVAVVQMHAHVAFEDEGKIYLGEPVGKPLDRPHLGHLDDGLANRALGSPTQKLLGQLRKHVARAYDLGLSARLKAILAYCEAHGAELVVFPEYSIPGTLVPALREMADQHSLAIVAGTHLVTTELLDSSPYADAFDSLPEPGQAIAPVIIPGQQVRFQPKLFSSQWETSLVLGEGPVLFCWEEKKVKFGVAICIDFLRNRDPEGTAAHEMWRDETDLMIVPSATPRDTHEQFANTSDHFFRSIHTPVVYANLAEHGGTGVFGHGKPHGRPLTPGSAVVPLARGREGIIITHLDLLDTASSTPRRYDADTPIRLIAYALILHPESHPALAQVARQLVDATDAAEFKQLCNDHEYILIAAAREFRELPWVKARWTALTPGSRGINNLADLRLRASDLWLPDHVQSLSQIEHALATATIQALRGIAAEPTSATDARALIQKTIDGLEKAIHVGSIPPMPDPPPPSVRALLEEVISFRTQNAPTPTLVTINPDGTLDPWVANPGPPPEHLVSQGFKHQPCTTIESESLRFDVEAAATWLALQDSPPSWFCLTPNETPALVVAPGHIVLVSQIVPPEADLRLARPAASKPLPIALLAGSSDGLSVSLPPDVVPLNYAIRQLAFDPEHLRHLADYEYTAERSGFVEPFCQFGPPQNASVLPGLAVLTRWLHAETRSAILFGALGDGRTTLLRTWLVGVARDALLRGRIPVRYVDATHWRTHDHFSCLLANLTPKQLAALRLAITTGNYLLVLDGIDDIFPDHVILEPFFHGWLSQSRVRSLQASCWSSQSNAVITLSSKICGKPWVTRSFLRKGDRREQNDHPPYTQVAELVDRLNRAISAASRDDKTTCEGVLSDLALAIWSRPTVTEDTLSTVHEAEFKRVRSARHSSTSAESDESLIKLYRALGFINIVYSPRPPTKTSLWCWHAKHRTLARSYSAPPQRAYGTEQWFSFHWDDLLNFLLAKTIVEDLARGDSTVLDIPPLYRITVDYCLQHPSWSQARPTILTILSSPPSRLAASVNALLLAAADESLASTAELPWHLNGLDLRSLTLAGCRLEHAQLRGARLDLSLLTSCHLHGADLSDAVLEGCDLSGADMSSTTAERARFTGARLDDTSLRNAVLQRADFSRSFAETRAPDFDGADLRDAIAHAIAWPSLPAELVARATWRAPSAARTQVEEIIPTPQYIDDGSLAWSCDDHFIATGDHHGRLWLWSSGPLRALAMLAAHQGILRAIAFSPDGHLIATAGDDTYVRLWSTSDLSAQGSIPHDEAVTGVSWENATTLWTFTGTPRRWSVAPQSKLLETVSAISNAYEGTLSVDGDYLITVERGSSLSKCFSIYSRDEFDFPHQVPSRSARLPGLNLKRGLAVSDTGDDIEVNSLFEFSSAKDKVTRTRRMINDGFPKETWSSDGETLATIHDLDNYGLWSKKSHTFTEVATSRSPSSVLFSNLDDRLLLLTRASLTVAFPATDVRDELVHARRFFIHGAEMHWEESKIRLHNNRDLVEVALNTATVAYRTSTRPHTSAESYPRRDHTGTLHLFTDTIGPAIWQEAEQCRHYLEAVSLPTGARKFNQDVMWSHCGRFVAIQQSYAVESGSSPVQLVDICVWEVESGKVRWHGTLSHRGHVVLLQDGVSLSFTARSAGNYIHIIDPSSSRRVSVQVGLRATVYISNDGQYATLRDPKAYVQVVSLRACFERLAEQAEGTHDTVSVHKDQRLWNERFWPDFPTVVFPSASDRLALVLAGRIEIRRTCDGVTLGVLHTETGAATSVAFSPDGKHLACYFGGEIQLWNIARSICIARIVLLRDSDDKSIAGAVAIAGPHFQRLLPEGVSTPPSIEGFFARSGVHLHALQSLANLESRVLIDDLCREVTPYRNS